MRLNIPTPLHKGLNFIMYSDLDDSWFPFHSATLKALADKLCHMIDDGNSPSIQPMLESICNNTIKKLQQPMLHKNVLES